jgi:hypothetical protein
MPHIFTPADLVGDPDNRQGYEQAYWRGAYQALELASDIADDAKTLFAARRTLRHAAGVAAEFRSVGRHPGRPALMDAIRHRLRWRRRPVRRPAAAEEAP